MWDVIYELPWVLGVVLGVVTVSLLPSLLVSFVQSRQLRKRLGVLQKELNVMTDCSMGMGQKLVTLEKVFSEGGLQFQEMASGGSKSEEIHSKKKIYSKQPANDSSRHNARTSELGQQNRFSKANHLLATGAEPEAVMIECGVSKAEIDLMRFLENTGTAPPKEAAEH